MNAELLVQMVNDITDFFYPAQDATAAAAAVAAHIRRSWDPRMLRQIVTIWQRGEGAFSDVGRAGVGLIAADPRYSGQQFGS